MAFNASSESRTVKGLSSCWMVWCALTAIPLSTVSEEEDGDRPSCAALLESSSAPGMPTGDDMSGGKREVVAHIQS